MSSKNEYVRFDGRVSRRVFWVYALAAFIVSAVAGIIPYLGALVGLALLLPGLGMAVRRLQDIGKSWKCMLCAFIPVVGSLVLIYFFVQQGQPTANEFGAVPPQKFSAPSAPAAPMQQTQQQQQSQQQQQQQQQQQ